MIIKNFEKLATSSLRRQLLTIAEAGYEAINTSMALKNTVIYDPKKDVLSIQGKKINLNKFQRVFVLCFGKAAFESSEAIKNILGNKVYRGIVIDVAKMPEKNEQWVYFQATHPNISEGNVTAAKETLSILNGLKEDDLIICGISGGGSAIFEIPYKIEPENAAKIFKAMTKGGATISELNTVRKHTSLVKGGQLAKHFFPAKIVNLIFSDVPGDDLSVIASGPLVMDATTVLNARDIIGRFNVLPTAGLPKIDLIETPKDNKYFKNISNFLVVSPKLALKAMQNKAEVLGWDVRIYSDRFEGEARLLGPKIVKDCRKGECLLGAGESTVKILGKGKGGRNQEMALAALPSMLENQVLGCFASDGHDFTDCAGAIVDSLTKHRASNLQLAPDSYLNFNDSFSFFDTVGDHIITGLTGSNIADFFVTIKE